jgi:hypothetical protein
MAGREATGIDKASGDLDAMPRRAARLALLYGHNTPVASAAKDIWLRISELRDEIKSDRDDIRTINNLYEAADTSLVEFVRSASGEVTRPQWRKSWARALRGQGGGVISDRGG